MKGSIWAVVVVAVVFAVAFLAIPAATSETAETRYANETHTLSSTSEVTLENASAWYRMVENETVIDAQNDTEYTKPDDYTIDYQNGTLTANSSSLADGNEVYVKYYWDDLDEQTETILALLSWAEVIVPFLFLAVCMGALFAMMGWW